MDYQQRRQAHADATRQAILDAAVAITREKGFEALTVREVCAAAGVTTGAFYHHFSAKEDLLTQGFSSLDEYLGKAMAPHDGDAPQERLEVLLRSYAQYMEDMGWQTMALYYTRRLSTLSEGSMSPKRYTLRAMRECFQALADQGTLSPQYDPQWTADFCFRHFRGIVVDWVLHRGAYSLWEKLGQDYALFDTCFRA